MDGPEGTIPADDEVPIDASLFYFPQYKRWNITLGASPVGGRGVFATADFREEEIVEICPSIEVHADDVGGKLCDYVFYGSDENQRVVVLGYGMMYNSSANANLRYEALPNGDFQYIATRSIRKGEELFIDYGVDWWSDQNRSVTYCPPPEPQQAPPPHPDGLVHESSTGDISQQLQLLGTE
eukprot:EG_transcript_27709